MKKYNKKITIPLTEQDYASLERIQDNSRLSLGQVASMMVEDAIRLEVDEVIDDTSH